MNDRLDCAGFAIVAHDSLNAHVMRGRLIEDRTAAVIELERQRQLGTECELVCCVYCVESYE